MGTHSSSVAGPTCDLAPASSADATSSTPVSGALENAPNSSFQSFSSAAPTALPLPNISSSLHVDREEASSVHDQFEARVDSTEVHSILIRIIHVYFF